MDKELQRLIVRVLIGIVRFIGRVSMTVHHSGNKGSAQWRIIQVNQTKSRIVQTMKVSGPISIFIDEGEEPGRSDGSTFKYKTSTRKRPLPVSHSPTKA